MGRSQHYVPQSYLRRFQAREGKVWVYDKKENRVYPKPTSTENIAQETGFYDLRGEGDDPEILEKQLAKFEGGFIDAMDVVLRIAENKESGGTPDERISMSKVIAFQHLRTRAWRDRTRKSYIELQERAMNTVWEMTHELAGEGPPVSTIQVSDGPTEEDRAWGLQVDAMVVNGAVDEIAQRVFESLWVIARNVSDRPFITSDVPVAVQQVVPLKSPIPEAPGQYERYIEVKGPTPPAGKGTQTFFPVSPRHALVVLDPSMHEKAAERDGNVLNVGRNSVDQINAAQMRKSQRWLFSSTEDFAGAIPVSWRFLRPSRFSLP